LDSQLPGRHVLSAVLYLFAHRSSRWQRQDKLRRMRMTTALTASQTDGLSRSVMT
jgi:hypothetical protein